MPIKPFASNSTEAKLIPVVDVFAGPGGLGEGFSSVVNDLDSNSRRFKIALSIEKDPFAYQTLLLRTFLRQFPSDQLPDEYYSFLEGQIESAEALYNLYTDQFKIAQEQAWKAILVKDKDGTIGVSDQLVDNRIREAINGARDWVLIGGPPCQAYSIVGRARTKGINPDDPRVYLYREYYRILAVHRPSVFVMENVKGLLSSKIKDDHIITQIIDDLQDPLKAYRDLHGTSVDEVEHPGYILYSIIKPPIEKDIFGDSRHHPKDFLIESEKYGIPQKRHRLILLGVRRDLAPNVQIQFLKAYSEGVVPLSQVIRDLPPLRSQLSGKNGETLDTNLNWINTIREGIADEDLWQNVDKRTLKLLTETGRHLTVPVNRAGGQFLPSQTVPEYNPGFWYTDSKLTGICNHETRAHIRLDILRYMFAACYTQVHGRFPHLADYPDGLLPAHKNVREGVFNGKFSDRFCVQCWNEPSRTVTSHISKDGHYYIHPDPGQSRSLTVREAARIQTFPDNYFFCGPRTAQFHQVGNAVPPYLAKQIAEIVGDLLNQINLIREPTSSLEALQPVEVL